MPRGRRGWTIYYLAEMTPESNKHGAEYKNKYNSLRQYTMPNISLPGELGLINDMCG
jgi:hypothetical protein